MWISVVLVPTLPAQVAASPAPVAPLPPGAVLAPPALGAVEPAGVLHAANARMLTAASALILCSFIQSPPSHRSKPSGPIRCAGPTELPAAFRPVPGRSSLAGA